MCPKFLKSLHTVVKVLHIISIYVSLSSKLTTGKNNPPLRSLSGIVEVKSVLSIKYWGVNMFLVLKGILTYYELKCIYCKLFFLYISKEVTVCAARVVQKSKKFKFYFVSSESWLDFLCRFQKYNFFCNWRSSSLPSFHFKFGTFGASGG